MTLEQRMRTAIARAIVRWVSRWWDASYRAHEHDPALWVGFWDRGAHRAERIGLPVARRLDRETTGAQMAEEGWWG